MNLVDYGSSDSENEEDTNSYLSQASVAQTNNETKLQNGSSSLTAQKNTQNLDNNYEENLVEKTVDFNLVPQPKSKTALVTEEINSPLPKKVDYGEIPKPPKSQKGKTKILIPSLSEFKNLEEDEEDSENSAGKPVKQKGFASKLLSSLPPPKSSLVSTKTNTMVPHVLTKKNEVKKVITKPPIKKSDVQTHLDPGKSTVIKPALAETKPTSSFSKSLSNYSDSEDEDDQTPAGTDFFSLSTPTKIPDELLVPISDFDFENPSNTTARNSNYSKMDYEEQNISEDANKKLTSTVMNLPKEEILLKNKIEVGPKLPIPEQEYNVDTQGNVAFDDKAIEYLCGKRGVKRKNEFDNVEILDINGEDIKPDERDWLVKALTEEQVVRPVSANAGPSGQSKKKHQITYLAHQAKSMELELKTQWAQSNHNRQQSRSKYGF